MKNAWKKPAVVLGVVALILSLLANGDLLGGILVTQDEYDTDRAFAHDQFMVHVKKSEDLFQAMADVQTDIRVKHGEIETHLQYIRDELDKLNGR